MSFAAAAVSYYTGQSRAQLTLIFQIQGRSTQRLKL